MNQNTQNREEVPYLSERRPMGPIAVQHVMLTDDA